MNEVTTLADRYIAAWNEADAQARLALVAQTYTEDATYLDPLMTGDGHEGIATMIGAAQGQFPGCRFRRTGDVQEHHGRVRFTWELFPEGGPPLAKGTDIAILENGRFRDVLGFLD
jgi:ketosteroid isomerase-like protein